MDETLLCTQEIGLVVFSRPLREALLEDDNEREPQVFVAEQEGENRRHGKILFAATADARCEFEERIMILYADFKPILDDFNGSGRT